MLNPRPTANVFSKTAPSSCSTPWTMHAVRTPNRRPPPQTLRPLRPKSVPTRSRWSNGTRNTRNSVNFCASMMWVAMTLYIFYHFKNRYRFVYSQAPKHLQFNPFIRHGYRTYLSTKMCLESIFWWTNETVYICLRDAYFDYNILTYANCLRSTYGVTYSVGFCSSVCRWTTFITCTIITATWTSSLWPPCWCVSRWVTFSDTFITPAKLTVYLFFYFQTCMILSSVYHTFSCRSEKHYECFLSFDLLGIALSLLAIYISGIYYAFWCDLVSEIVYIYIYIYI